MPAFNPVETGSTRMVYTFKLFIDSMLKRRGSDKLNSLGREKRLTWVLLNQTLIK
jgi:hypothetical protein